MFYCPICCKTYSKDTDEAVLCKECDEIVCIGCAVEDSDEDLCKACAA